MGQNQGMNGGSLTTEQQQLIQDTLSEFDFENLTENDALSIVETFEAAGIQPGNALVEAMASAGFDARAVGEMAGVQDPQGGQSMPPPPPPPKSSGMTMDEESMNQIISLLDQLYSEDMEESTRQQAIDEIRELLVPEEGLFSAQA